MKRLLLAIVIAAAAPALAAAQDFAGRWEISAKELGKTAFFNPMTDGRLTIARDGADYTATYDALRFRGAAAGGTLRLACTTQSGACGDLALTLAGGGLRGKGVIAGAELTLTGRRPTPRPPAARIHEFKPSEFHSLYSGAIAPALRLFPGDTVRTETIDNRGVDAADRRRSPRGNPQTGPFFIEGAMPGDTLVVRLDRVRTNRDTALQTNSVWAAALNPAHARTIAPQADPAAVWKLDGPFGVLAQPSERLADYHVELAPMLGGIGVAPPRDQAWATSNLGSFGGNLDYKAMVEGAIVYLPVFEPGALLFLGDGHAVQADGEITGQGLETSLDVQFTVDLIEGRSLGQPWAEDARYVMIMGVGQSLDDALRQATTGASLWLKDRYRLSDTEVAAVLGTALEYDIAEVVDPQFHIVAKLPKTALSLIRP